MLHRTIGKRIQSFQFSIRNIHFSPVSLISNSRLNYSNTNNNNNNNNNNMSVRKTVMIPGPIEFSDAVLDAMSTKSQAHTSPEFIAVFQEALQNTRKVFQSTDPKAQPYVIAGSGTLGWDILGSNLLDSKDRVLVLSTGFFADNLGACLSVYSDNVEILKSSGIGKSIELNEIKSKLEDSIKEKKPYSLITITQTDTSSAVLSDVESISKLIKEISPETLIAVDGVCSIAVENLEFDNWGIDYALTASQKALATPSGLSISMISGRALDKALNSSKKIPFFTSLAKWTPIMQAYENGKGAYFATPPIQLIHAYKTSLNEILSESIKDRFKKHEITSTKFKDNLESIGLKLVASDRKSAANGLTAIYFPEEINGTEFLGILAKKGWALATGIYAGYQTKYFRVGHMGVSAIVKDDVDRLFKDIKETLTELGYKY